MGKIIVRDTASGRVINVSRNVTQRDIQRSDAQRRSRGQPVVKTTFSKSVGLGGGRSAQVDITGRVTIKKGSKVESKLKIKPKRAINIIRQEKVFARDVKKFRQSISDSRKAKSTREKDLKRLSISKVLTSEGRAAAKEELRKIQRSPAQAKVEKTFERQRELSLSALTSKGKRDALTRAVFKDVDKVQELVLSGVGVVKDPVSKKFRPRTLKEKVIFKEAKVARKIGAAKLAQKIRNFSRKVKFSDSPSLAPAKFGFEVATEDVTSILEKPISNTLLVVIGFSFRKLVKVSGKILKIIAKFKPGIASKLRAGGRISMASLTALYGASVVQQGAEELARSGKLSKTTADLIRELALLGVGSRLAGKKLKIPKRLLTIRSVANKLLKVKKPTKSFFKKLKIVKQKPIQKKLVIKLKGKPKKSIERAVERLPAIRQQALKRLQAEVKKNKPIVSKLEKQRRALRRGAGLASKIARGLQVKARREGTSIINNKQVWLLEDAFTGKVRRFNSRKQWLSAVKLQLKLLKSGLKPKAPVEFTTFFKKTTTKFDVRFLEKPIDLAKVKPKRQIGLLRKDIIKETTRRKPELAYYDYKVNKLRYAENRKSFVKAVKRQSKFLEGQSKVKNSKEVLELEKQRRVLRKQLAASKKGKTPKAVRLPSGVKGGKPVFAFENYSTKVISYFSSRNKWFKAIKNQQKLIKAGKVKVPKSSAVKKTFEFSNKQISKVKTKSKRKPRQQIKTLVPSKLSVVIKKGGKTFRVSQEKDGSTKIFLLSQDKEISKGGRVLLLEQKLKKPKLLKVVKAKQKVKLKQKVKQRVGFKQRVITIQKVKTKQGLKQLAILLFKTSALEKAILKQSQRLKVGQKQRQRLKQKQAQKQKFAQKQKVKQKPKQKLRVGLKLKVSQRQKFRQKQRVTQKKRFKQKLKRPRPIKIPKPPKPPKKPPKEEFEKKKRKLKKLINFKIKKDKFFFIPDLFSIVFGIRASKAERKAFLRKGRLFTGAEIRKLIR